MNRFCRNSLLFSTLLAVPSLFANTIDNSGPLDQRDIQALREWVNTKRQVTVKEIGGALSLSGEVRFELQSTNEKVNGIRQRGPGAPLYGRSDGNYYPYPTNSWDIEVNVMLDYRTDRTWSAIKLEFDNNAGIYGGSLNRIKLEKAYFGVRAIESDAMNFDIEVGRRKMSTFLDSNLEFASIADGVVFRVAKSFEKAGDFYSNLAAFIVDERNNHYGYVGEIGLLNVASTGLETKYSLVKWNSKRSASFINLVNFDFLVSQLILGYRFVPGNLGKMVKVYVAGLYNHAAEARAITANKKANAGGYIGFSIGQARKKGDWSFDANYQVLQAQAVPDFDEGGIGLGNTPNAGLYSVNIDGSGGPTTLSTAAGNGNFRGFQFTLDYLLTDAIIMQQQWQQSITLDDSIGPFRQYKQYEIEFIYAF